MITQVHVRQSQLAGLLNLKPEEVRFKVLRMLDVSLPEL
jgi:hypothetical protein